MKKILLSKGYFAIVDNDDYFEISKHNWCYMNGYAARIKRVDKKDIVIRMHREILGVKDKNILCDHLNLNKLDNRKVNLRTATKSQNSANRTKPAHNTSGHKNISWHKGAQKWSLEIIKDGKKNYFGLFGDINEAIKRRNIELVNIFGEYAHQ